MLIIKRCTGYQIFVEILELPATDNRYVARTKRVLQFAHRGQLVEPAIDAAFLKHEPPPPRFDEGRWRIDRHFSGVASVHLAQNINRVHQVLTRRRRTEIEGFEERRRIAPQLREVVDEQRH